MPPLKKTSERRLTSIDTETTGIDFYHGAQPFLVTTCDDELEQTFWEWRVDPFTRQPNILEEDVEDIRRLLTANVDVVGQNIKFDVAAMTEAGIVTTWDWSRTFDTIHSGHLLASNQPRDLTSMVLAYLHENVQPFEDRVKAATTEARKIAKAKYCRAKVTASLFDDTPASTNRGWRIAQEDLHDMPSINSSSKRDEDKPWKNDMWLPREIAFELQYDDDHPWWTVTSEYANSDSMATILLFKRHRELLLENGLWELYLAKLKVIQPLFEMERRGTTVSMSALREHRDEYREDSRQLGEQCVSLAKGRGYSLEMPKGAANNKSLTSFVFDVLKLPVLKETETGQPSFDKDVIASYCKTLEKGTTEHLFVDSLRGKRKRDKSLEYLSAYERFGIERADGYAVLHPSVNGTGTSTTRFSMSNPNLQQVSKQETGCPECEGEGCETCDWTGEDLHSVRKIFRPADGRELWSMDASNIELRIPAYESGEELLIALFERPDDPPFYGSQHMLNFSIIYPDIWEDVINKVGFEKAAGWCKKTYKSTWYQWCKNGDFGLQYQCGEATADAAFHRPGSYKRLKSSFVKLDALNKRCVAFANKHGYVETVPDRSVNPEHGYPLYCAQGWGGGIVPTVPLNYRTQGTAGWWMIRAMTRCFDQLQQWHAQGFHGYMVLTVHDELVFDFPKGKGSKPWLTNLPKIAKLQSLMEQGGRDIGIPTPTSREYHPVSWGEGVSV
jgi:DNA polymerase I-like protein with 3'-5' exonuclease and polymerase domains